MGKEKIRYGPKFEKDIKKFRDFGFLEKIQKQISKIKDNPGIGKPLKYDWKGSREVRIGPYRLFLKQKVI